MNKHKAIAISFLLAIVTACSSESSEHRPVYSPDGAKIVYMSMSDATGGDWELYVMNADGSNPVRLTDHEGWDGYAVWAPDGKSVIFDREDSGKKESWFLDIASGKIRALGTYDGWMAINDWSDDGSTLLAFHEVDGQRDLYLLNTRGKVLRRLTDTPQSNEHDAHFSPDETTVAYSSGPKDGSGTTLEIINLDSGESSVVVNSSGRAYGVAWSPSGTQIAYTDNPPGGDDDDANVFLLDIATGQTRQLTENEAWDHMPEFHPDGKTLLFTSYRSGSEHMYQYDLESGDITRLKPADNN